MVAPACGFGDQKGHNPPDFATHARVRSGFSNAAVKKATTTAGLVRAGLAAMPCDPFDETRRE
jgi:hypothetical protein